MAIKKSQLYNKIWTLCDELRGGMDASQYKDYVLVLLFIKYISDKYVGIDYASITIPEGSSFKDMVALKGKATIGDDINKKIIAPIMEANKLSGMPDFNDPEKLGSGQEMVKKLTNLIAVFEDPALDFSKNRAEGDDILGDAYEYLMRHFATESGKSKGQFYTPAEVSRILAKTIGIAATANEMPTVYDPTCGSGSLLLKVADETDNRVSLYGQEMDNATAGLARMNMILHEHDTAEIVRENTLASPFFKEGSRLKTFDFVVANPPFSFKAWSNGIDPQRDPYERFKNFGVPPAKNGDYAFLLHIIRSLNSTGKGACILPHGVLFRGNAEAEIRKNIICRGYIKGIIGLPANLFYGTGIPACIIILDKENAENRKGIFIIDASKGFMKDGNKNRLRAQDIHKIVDAFNKQLEIPKYSRMVSLGEIEKNDFNLNIPRYINNQEMEDIQDIEAHLKGGIPASDIEDLQVYWQVYPTIKTKLFGMSGREGYYTLRAETEAIKCLIFSDPEFNAYAETTAATFARWRKETAALLATLTVGVSPKMIIHQISETILVAFNNTALLDKYDTYQHLMEYWTETMQDDLYLIAANGWQIELLANQKGEWESDLVPKQLVINHYLLDAKHAIEQLQTKLDNLEQEFEVLIEENNTEDGCFSDFDKVTKAAITARIKAIKDNPENHEELMVLEKCLELIGEQTEIKKAIKAAEKDLDTKVVAKYKMLTEAEVKDLVINDKWLAAIEQAVKGEMERISQRLALRIKELAERYAAPLSQLETKVAKLKQKVAEHLAKMGFCE